MSNYKIKVISNRVLIRERVFKTKTDGGIEIPPHLIEWYQNMETEGEIIAIGSTAFADIEESKRPKVGDIAYYQKYDKINKKYNDINYRIISDDCIFAYSAAYINPKDNLEE